VGDYLTAAEFANRWPKFDMTNETPDTTDVDFYITDVEAQVNGVLRSVGISTAVTDATAIAYLKTVTFLGVSTIYIDAKFALDETNEKAERFRKRFETEIERIRKTPGIITSTAGVSADEFIANGAGNYNSDEFDAATVPGEPDPDFDSDYTY